MLRIKRSLSANICLLLISVATAILITELVLRIIMPYASFGTGRELSWARHGADRLREIFTIDPEFGFRPTLGTGCRDEYGIKAHNYAIEKMPGVVRLLFVGDSVTNRGRIVQAIRDIYGEESYEYWNAGVGSFNTEQELAFYRSYNHKINPDHVILTFHLNDFDATPVVFINKENKLVIYAPDRNLTDVSRFLFRRSYLYRAFLGLSFGGDDRRIEHRQRELTACLKDFRDILAMDDIALTVLVFPWLRDHESWLPKTILRRILILEILDELGIQHFDLLPCLDYAFEIGINVHESKRDPRHPSDEFSEIIARHLYERGFLTVRRHAST